MAKKKTAPTHFMYVPQFGECSGCFSEKEAISEAQELLANGSTALIFTAQKQYRVKMELEEVK